MSFLYEFETINHQLNTQTSGIHPILESDYEYNQPKKQTQLFLIMQMFIDNVYYEISFKISDLSTLGKADKGIN